ncbi:glycoside hydrolase family 88 protein [Pedobacter nanyangensis]|uniref:glycoside hydrolase family 88 protein n=1 Tax=Pedobacter nanyangensis TaxID=1562389 RepID=UPI001F0598E4|nr:glycoside hydrolase family 88 protein [Pedobacter nanyangensis]
MMTLRFSICLFAFLFPISMQAQPKPVAETPQWLEKSVKVARQQLMAATRAYQPGLNPRSTNQDGSARLADYKDWITGFFPGSLWYGYELTGEDKLAKAAERFTLGLDSLRYLTHTHDLGFMIYCSYGNGYRITNDKKYLPVLEQGAKNLNARFNPIPGVIRSWDFGEWKYPVIIDNMMNLEYLYWAAQQFHEPKYTAVANTHALTTMKNHFRNDYSSYHVVDYDPKTGAILQKGTHQGLTNESAWSRGQAWGLYGYTMCYENTKNQKFLDQAEKIAAYIMNHPNTPADKIPVWDYDVHNVKSERAPRDASAAAVIASALIELSTQVKDGKKYLDYAEDMLKSLSGDQYLAKPGENNFFILKHSVGAFLFNSEIDTPLAYADYYYLEALKRYAQVKHFDTKK